MRSLVLLVLAATLLAGCTSHVQDDAGTAPEQSLPTRPNAWPGTLPLTPQISRISDGAEPTLVVSKDGSTIWIGDTSGMYLSQDNGTTWVEADTPTLIGTADGWVMAEDDQGTLYYSTTNTVSLEFVRSHDQGRTADYSTALTDVAPVADRPWIAARGDGEVALFMYDFGRSTSETCVHSTDAGENWDDRSLLTGSPQGGGAFFDEFGNMYVGLDNGKILSYGTSCTMATADLGTTYYDMFIQDLGANNMLKPEYEDGVLYMAAAGAGNNQVLLSGLALGASTPTVIPVSPPVLQSNAFATLSIQDGRIAVAWYGSETAGDPSDAAFAGEFNVYLAVVDDFWTTPTVEVTRLTAEPNHVGDICMSGISCTGDSDRDLLDYFGIDQDPWGGIHVAYGHDGAGSDSEVRYAFVAPPTAPAVAPTDTTTETDTTQTVSDTATPEPVRNRPPTARFTHAEQNLQVQVDASTTEDPDGGDLSYTWDWGDNTFGQGVTASHEYTAAGTYLIRLSVTDDHGAVATSKAEVLMTAPPAPSPPKTTSETGSNGIPGPSWSMAAVFLLVAVAVRRR